MDDGLGAAAANSLGDELAAVDERGQIGWANEAWLRAANASADLLAHAVIGANLLGLLRARSGRERETADAIAEVISGRRSRYAGQLNASDDSRPRVLVAVPLRAPYRGAVVSRSAVASAQSPELVPPVPDDIDVAATIAALTPRELDVLELMIQGLDNRGIAGELGIAYTTVRSHTRSLIAKLGARSRLHAVARAYAAGLRGPR